MTCCVQRAGPAEGRARAPSDPEASQRGHGQGPGRGRGETGPQGEGRAVSRGRKVGRLVARNPGHRAERSAPTPAESLGVVVLSLGHEPGEPEL